MKARGNETEIIYILLTPKNLFHPHVSMVDSLTYSPSTVILFSRMSEFTISSSVTNSS